MTIQPQLGLKNLNKGPVECLGIKFPDEQARREYFLDLLSKKLKDQAFRKIAGFPLGEDAAILALSDPPYYTACPNPWFDEFVKHYGKNYDTKMAYHRDPFSADVSEGKNHPIYMAHSYHTKVPHRAIMRYILHYTDPGDLVFDGFCGTGMTGVAAKLCGSRTEVESLGYRVDPNGKIMDANGVLFSTLGERRPILSELSPAASFISYNYNVPKDAEIFEQQALDALAQTTKDCAWMFRTLIGATEDEIARATTVLGQASTWERCAALLENEESLKQAIQRPKAVFRFAQINYAVWSDIFICSECSQSFIFWEQAVNESDWQVRDKFHCPHCKAVLTKDKIKQSKETISDRALNTTIQQTKVAPVLIHYRDDSGKGTKKPDSFDLLLAEKPRNFVDSVWFPTNRMIEGSEARRNDPFGITHIHHFYTPRNLLSLAHYANQLGDSRNFVNVTSVGTIATRMYRFRSQNGSLGAGGGPLSGTLYVPSLSKEIPVLKMLHEHINKTTEVKRLIPIGANGIIQTGSSTSLASIPANSLDYLFIDPPFGGNLMYSDLNFLWEAWLKVLTNRGNEAITDKSQGKELSVYKDLMLTAFREFYRILKPGRWMTVEFSNSQACVWNVIQSTLQEAGFVVANVAALDKKQGSFKAVTTTTAVKQDLVISAYKPNGGLEDRFSKHGETEEGVWDFLRTHFKNLPRVKAKGGQLEFIAERDPRILYDRTVAFYVVHSTPVPLSSAEFQAGLSERFPERDGMYFLPEQVAEYDKKRAQVECLGQLTIFVEDEKSAINWLREYLKKTPSTYQEVQPEFMQQLSASWKKWETRPELKVLLDQNFLCYSGDGEVPSQIHSYLSTQFKDLRKLEKENKQLQNKAKDRWYVPDPRNAVQVEEIRNKHLLAEFWTYLPTGYSPQTEGTPTLPGLDTAQSSKAAKKKFKEVRTEAVRVGFKHCFQLKDYKTILMVARQLPETIIEEDEQLQMIYDMAELRGGGN